MEDFYEYNPTDDAGKATKASYQANMVQSALDSQLAQQLAMTNAGLAQQNMTHQADLELQNQTALMENGLTMGKIHENSIPLENKFANKQHNRDLSMLQKTGQQERKTLQAQGQQDRKNIGARSKADLALQSKVGQQAMQQIKGQGQQDRKTIGAQSDADVRLQKHKEIKH